VQVDFIARTVSGAARISVVPTQLENDLIRMGVIKSHNEMRLKRKSDV
jgi:hypothetical protein